jgi:UDP-N-acetylmuramoylalanine--D-glutamate ligase
VRSSDLVGARVAILGAGREGTAALASVTQAASVVVVADEGESPIVRDLAGIEVDVAIKSPGIPPSHPVVRDLVSRGVPITSGTDLWLGEHAAATTGVTGSKGKSTTASLVHALQPATALGGNIGIPLLALEEADRYVVELSSYQCQSLTVSPDVAVVTSLFPEHLNWHGSVEQYYSDKLNIVRHGPRVVVANGEDETLRAHLDGDVLWVGGDHEYRVEGDWIVRGDERILPVADLPVRGRHNALNATIALAAADAVARVPADAAADRLRAFRPLEHRLEVVADPGGAIVFVDDSLSTSPFAAIEALKAFPDEGAVLLVGGQDRGVEYAPLAEYLARHPITGVVGLPPSGERILGELPGVVRMATDMTDAVTRAIALGATSVILSPAAPSYGIYRDFAERAADFRRAIQEIRA